MYVEAAKKQEAKVCYRNVLMFFQQSHPLEEETQTDQWRPTKSARKVSNIKRNGAACARVKLRVDTLIYHVCRWTKGKKNGNEGGNVGVISTRWLLKIALYLFAVANPATVMEGIGINQAL